MMRFTGIQAPDTHLYMPEAWALLRPAAERNGHHTEESVRAALLKRDFQLWCAFKGEEMVMATITEIAQYPGVRQCIVIMCGGKNMDDWLYPCLSAGLQPEQRYSREGSPKCLTLAVAAPASSRSPR
jgi:hypothetical protein